MVLSSRYPKYKGTKEVSVKAMRGGETQHPAPPRQHGKETGTSAETLDPPFPFLPPALSRDALLESLTITQPRTSSVSAQPRLMQRPPQHLHAFRRSPPHVASATVSCFDASGCRPTKKKYTLWIPTALRSAELGSEAGRSSQTSLTNLGVGCSEQCEDEPRVTPARGRSGPSWFQVPVQSGHHTSHRSFMETTSPGSFSRCIT